MHVVHVHCVCYKTGAAAFFPDSEQRHHQLITLLQTSSVRMKVFIFDSRHCFFNYLVMDVL